MTNFLSLLIAMMMLATGAGSSANPTALASISTSISNIVVTLDGEEYPIDPTATFTLQTENNAALMDFHMTLGENTLFPIQAKFDDSGISMKVKDSKVYTFSADMINSANEIYGLAEISRALEAYTELTKASEAPLTAEDEAALDAFLNELSELSVPEKTTLTRNGKAHPAQRYVFTISHEQLIKSLDKLSSSSYMEAYWNYTSELNSLMGEDGIQSFDDLFQSSNTTCSIDVDLTSTLDEELIDGSLTFHVTSYGETMTFPLYLTFEEDELKLSFEMYESGVRAGMQVTAALKDDVLTTSMDMRISDSGLDLIVKYTVVDNDKTLDEDFHMDFMLPDRSNLVYAYDTHTEENGNTDANYKLSMFLEGHMFGARFNTTTLKDTPIQDHFDDSNAIVIHYDYEMDKAFGLEMALLGMASDAEKLIYDPSISELVKAFEAFDAYFTEPSVPGLDLPNINNLLPISYAPADMR